MDLTTDRPDRHALLSPKEVAKLFDVTPKTISRWHDAGILPGQRTTGGHRRFRSGPVFDLFDYLVEVGGHR